MSDHSSLAQPGGGTPSTGVRSLLAMPRHEMPAPHPLVAYVPPALRYAAPAPLATSLDFETTVASQSFALPLNRVERDSRQQDSAAQDFAQDVIRPLSERQEQAHDDSRRELDVPAERIVTGSVPSVPIAPSSDTNQASTLADSPRVLPSSRSEMATTRSQPDYAPPLPSVSLISVSEPSSREPQSNALSGPIDDATRQKSEVEPNVMRSIVIPNHAGEYEGEYARIGKANRPDELPPQERQRAITPTGFATAAPIESVAPAPRVAQNAEGVERSPQVVPPPSPIEKYPEPASPYAPEVLARARALQAQLRGETIDDSTSATPTPKPPALSQASPREAVQPLSERAAEVAGRGPNVAQIMLQMERRLDALESVQRAARPSPSMPVKSADGRPVPAAPETRMIVRVVTRQNATQGGSTAFWQRQSSAFMRGRLLR